MAGKGNAQGANSVDRRVVRTRKAIHQAFFELAGERSVDKITVSSVAERANINRKTFYLHYDSIEELIEELVQDEVARLCDALEGECVKADGSIDVTALFVSLDHQLEEGLTLHPDLYRYTDTDWALAHVEPTLVRLIIERDSLHLADALGDYLDYVVTFFCAGLMAAYKKWVNRSEDVDLSNLTTLLSMAATGGLAGCSLEGRHLGIAGNAGNAKPASC